MKVRAKRLVFREVTPVLSDRKWRAETPFGDYEILESGGNFSCYYRNQFITHAASLESAQTACQVDFDRRWRESTEVPDLVWSSAEEMTVFGMLMRHRSKCRQWEYSCTELLNGRFGWMASISGDSSSIVNGSKSSLDLAKLACNAHNRAAVLGE